jgi:uncharacterized repeat protein (TIGR03803 family)
MGASSTNLDGAQPWGNLILSGNTLYGTTEFGGRNGYGTLFALHTDGTSFTNLHDFGAQTNNGFHPKNGLVLVGNVLYGTAPGGGANGGGIVFSLSLPALPPELAIQILQTNVFLTWPTNRGNFSLQSAPAINGPFTNVDGATSPFTKAITEVQQFFRLGGN